MQTPSLIATLTLNPSLDELYTLDRLRLEAVNRADGMARYPGGKGINVSRVVHELGGRTCAFGFAGGRDGQWLADALDALGVAHRFTRIAGTTRNNLKILVRRPRQEWQINTPGPRIGGGALRALMHALEMPRPRPAWLVCSGSVPPGVPPGIYRRLIARAQRDGLRCVLDADGASLRIGLAAQPALIKPNHTEAEGLLGRRLRTLAAVAVAARALTQRGVVTVIISLGRAGAVMAQRRSAEVWAAPSPPVRVDSTVGAGDSLVAGVLVGLARGWPPAEAFRLGMACGAACAMTPGTELVHRLDVQRLLPRVRLRRLRL